MKKISIIVPVYNVGKNYLCRCLNSLVNQTYSDLEIIVINDGSTDDSDKIIIDYLKRDNRIKYFNRENHGVSSTRNFGIENCTGDYITFVDSDDYIESYMYEKLMQLVNDCDYDIIASSAYYETENGYIFDDLSKKFKDNLFLNSNEINRSILIGELGGAVWNKIFKKSVILDNNILFDVNIHSCEDLLFLIECAIHSNSAYYLNESFYHYVKRNNSVTNMNFNTKVLSCVYAYDKIVDYFKDNAELFDISNYSFSLALSNVIFKLVNTKQDKGMIKDFHLKLKKSISNSKFQSPYFSRENIILFLMFINPYVATFIWKKYKKINKYREEKRGVV